MQANIYIGSDKWGRQEWVGKLYPSNTSERDKRKHYAAIFNFVEYNASHYKQDTTDTLRPFATAIAGKDFKFCPLIQFELSKRFFEEPEQHGHVLAHSHDVYKTLGKQFGVSVLPLPAFSKQNTRLFEMICECPHDNSLAIALHERNLEKGIEAELINHLNEQKAGVVLLNQTYQQAAELTSPFIYVRLNVASKFPKLEEVLKVMPAEATELYVCITGDPYHQHKVADVLLEFKNAAGGLVPN